ncbi:HAMP domain-containing histidine kinase [Cytobacillus solani]|uniref:sensor histidine kinase n=1 Tax=Cytobacillus solani TaxID=1637975 RepID=UPI0020798051|nr:HAMP domain-containing sensor histidine kinase [Cytobacillus solani]USK55935.1 HAMP domain-containing histidine kinase [Cytobacillus solani]
MKRLRRRLFLHFSFQFISLAVAIIILFFFILLITIVWITKDESKYNYYQTKIESISMDTGSSLKEITMPDGWDKDLAEEGIWVQLINHKGEVIESGNVPDSIPKQYSQHDLHKMQETNELQGYSLYFYLETLYEEPYLFVLGHEDKGRKILQQIIGDYGKEGMISQEQLKQVEDQLLSIDGFIKVYDVSENLIQEVGSPSGLDKELPLDVFVRKVAPDIYSTKTTIIKDPATQALWVLYTPNKNKEEIKLDSLKEIIIAFAVSGVIVLVVTIVISFWNGFRYGNPLFIFTSWLSRMGTGKYNEVLTEKEKKLIFRKNGKVRLKYRLYAEVFQAFYAMAEKLAASTKEREQLEKTREEWMAGISHDLRTPLTTMQGYGTLLESGQYEWSKQELEDIGRTIGEKSAYMLSLIEDFSLSFRLKNEAALVDFQSIEVNQLLTSIVIKFHEDMTLSDYHLSFDPLNHNLSLQIAKRWFERMMDNLIYNAIIHNPPGTAIRIVIEEDSGSGKLKIMIKDNGIGMDEETRKHLFNRYYRGTSTDERVEGSGLGMSIAMQIAELHKGDIIVDSEINKGTVVTVCIPLPQDNKQLE